MVESLADIKEAAALGEPIFLWLITDKDYSELRKIEGCGMLGNLGATKTDAVHIVNFAKGLGIPDENIFKDEAAELKDLTQTYKKILALTRKLSVKEEKEHTVLVYCGGHGASMREQ